MTSTTAPKLTFNQVLCGLADGVTALSASCVIGYTSAALLSMREDESFNITKEEESWVGAIVPGAALIGSLVTGEMLDKFGRKNVCRAMPLPTLLAWLWIATSKSPFQVIVGRLFCGICIGIQQVTTAVYVSETVHPKLKPKLSIIPALSMMGGFFLITICGDWRGWRAMGWFGAVTCVLPLLLFLYLPETPYFLMTSGRETESLATLKWIRSEDEAKQEYENLQQSISSSDKKLSSSFKNISKQPYRWPMCIAILLHILQQGTGISAVVAFMGIILKEAESPVDQVTTTLIMTIINLGSIVLVGSIMSKYPRKVFIKYSSLIMIFSLLILSGFLWIKEREGILSDMVQSFSLIPLLALTGYFFGFSLGWGPIPWVFIGDGLPLKIRATGAGIVTAINWGFNFLTTKSFSWGKMYLGSPALFLLYAQLTLFGMLIMVKFIPETFGFTDIQLEKYYKALCKKPKSN